MPQDSSDGSEHLDEFEQSERRREPEGSKRRKASMEELPEFLYRLKTLHSNETSFGYFEPGNKDWPRFHTEAELDALLNSPVVVAESAAQADATIVQDELSTDSGVKEPDELHVSEDSSKQAAETDIPDAEASSDGAPQVVAQTPRAHEPHAPARRIPDKAFVIAPTKYGKDIVEVQGLAHDTSFINPDELVLIERPAGIDDLRRLRENREKEKFAYEHCRDKIWARNLPMKLVSAHYLLDEPKILFYFTAESRVDFRELVKDLVQMFKMRIELRQIGVRDEARVTGGCGVCGRVLCCHGISDRLNPVSIKMAKDQNLSLNSLKISGPCGRLLCCLSYEYQFYRDARRELPQEGVKFIYDGTLFKVVEVNALSSTVKMAGEDGRVLDMSAERFKYSEGRWKVIEE
jgi:cell fate regulator YaaT (PSP1 superfamily)